MIRTTTASGHPSVIYIHPLDVCYRDAVLRARNGQRSRVKNLCLVSLPNWEGGSDRQPTLYSAAVPEERAVVHPVPDVSRCMQYKIEKGRGGRFDSPFGLDWIGWAPGYPHTRLHCTKRRQKADKTALAIIRTPLMCGCVTVYSAKE